jgi:hypothetical protein
MARVVALPPNPESVHVGSGDADIKDKVGKEGARTIPGRPEHGGNCDIKNLSRGSKVFLPVHVKGAKFSVGDLHFSRKFCPRSLQLMQEAYVSKQRVMARSPSVVLLKCLELSQSSSQS